MLGTKNRNIKIIGAAWLVLGVVSFAIALFAIAQAIIDPSATEDGFLGGVIFVVLLFVLGSIGAVNGLVLLRRNPMARPLLAISSLVLLVPSTVGVATGAGIPAFLMVVGSLWLTLSRNGKGAFESYVARENG